MILIESIREPSSAERAAIKAVAADCDLIDGTSTDIRFDKSLNFYREMPSWFLARGAMGDRAPSPAEDAPVGFLSVFAPEAETAELTAMVHPDWRRRGVFAALLEAAGAELRSSGYRGLLFVRDAASFAGGEVMAGWGARRSAALDHREYAMLLGSAGGTCADGRPNETTVPPGVFVARGGRPDIPELAALSSIAFGDAEDESKKFLEATLANPARTILVARGTPGGPAGESRRQAVLGMVSVFVEGRESSINALIVRPDARRQGIGSLLLDRAIAHAKGGGASLIGLDVDALNRGALGLYLRRGFEMVSEMEYWRVAL